jgi:hypothetical protein
MWRNAKDLFETLQPSFLLFDQGGAPSTVEDETILAWAPVNQSAQY